MKNYKVLSNSQWTRAEKKELFKDCPRPRKGRKLYIYKSEVDFKARLSHGFEILDYHSLLNPSSPSSGKTDFRLLFLRLRNTFHSLHPDFPRFVIGGEKYKLEMKNEFCLKSHKPSLAKYYFTEKIEGVHLRGKASDIPPVPKE